MILRAFLVIILSLLTVGCIENSLVDSSVVLVSFNDTIPTPIPTQTSDVIPILTPSYIPNLKPYDVDKSSDIWHAKNSSSYITPNNEWVKYYASLLYINEDGYVMYKDEDNIFTGNYVKDIDQFNYEDYWINADYYLVNNLKGDCEDYVIALVSMMLSGEMSVKVNDTFQKQVILSEVVSGYTSRWLPYERATDAWIEYDVNGEKFITSQPMDMIMNGKLRTIKLNDVENYGAIYGDYEPVFRFTNKYFRRILR